MYFKFSVRHGLEKTRALSVFSFVEICGDKIVAFEN